MGRDRWGRSRGRGWGRAGFLRCVQFSAGASNQISLMKWIYGVQPDEPEATDILSCAS